MRASGGAGGYNYPPAGSVGGGGGTPDGKAGMADPALVSQGQQEWQQCKPFDWNDFQLEAAAAVAVAPSSDANTGNFGTGGAGTGDASGGAAAPGGATTE